MLAVEESDWHNLARLRRYSGCHVARNPDRELSGELLHLLDAGDELVEIGSL